MILPVVFAVLKYRQNIPFRKNTLMPFKNVQMFWFMRTIMGHLSLQELRTTNTIAI